MDNTDDSNCGTDTEGNVTVTQELLQKVSPEERAQMMKRHFDSRRSIEFSPPEDSCTENGYGVFEGRSNISPYTGDMADRTKRGRRLFFEDRTRRIDHILAWDTTEKETNKVNEREVFERNLEEEGLELEYDVKESRDVQYVKIHAPWEVLSRYAEIMKIRMPIKEVPENIENSKQVPEDIQTATLWETITDYVSLMTSPFRLDPAKVPPLPKKFTHPYERGKEYLFAIPQNKDLFFSHATRSYIVDYILRRKRYTVDSDENLQFGIKRLLSNDVYSAAYPLHEGSWKTTSKPSMRRLLYENWASWKTALKLQPLDYIRVYFGEKLGLYFAWLGYYTYMLLFPSIVGIIVFFYGLITVSNDVVSDESCDPDNNFTMCPKCDTRCPYWDYSTVCREAKASYMFDNGVTVFFAIFMCLWGTCFLEFWKREEISIQFKWNTMTFEEEEQPPRPEYIQRLSTLKFRKRHPVSQVEEPFLPFWRRKVPVYVASASVMLFLVTVAVACIIGVYVYRIVILFLLNQSSDPLLYGNASMVTAATAACINLIIIFVLNYIFRCALYNVIQNLGLKCTHWITAACFNLIIIFVLNYIYAIVAVKLTDWECLRTQSEYDSSLTFKLYVLQFVNYYSSLFYIAFIKGRFTGRPGDYNTLFGARQEECQGGGCLIELVIQLAIIFVGKQLIQNTLMEILLPRIMKRIRLCRGEELDAQARRQLAPWEKDYMLDLLGSRGLYNEYLEMMIQFGFVTLFVAAFPLAPAFAFINNILEIRTDANNFITQLRRPIAARVATIGIWYDVMFGVSRIAILTNAFLIAFTTGFIHRLVYSVVYSPDGNLNGYVNYTLSYFNVSDFETPPYDGEMEHVKICRYLDYREPPWSENPYVYTSTYWHVLAAQFMFIVVFENFVVVVTNFIAYIIPDVPRKLREQMRREAYLTNEIILKTELQIAQGGTAPLSDKELGDIRRRAESIRFFSDGPDGVGLGEGGTDTASERGEAFVAKLKPVPTANSQLDAGSMTNKLGWDTEEEGEAPNGNGRVNGSGEAYRRKAKGTGSRGKTPAVGGAAGTSSGADGESFVSMVDESIV